MREKDPVINRRPVVDAHTLPDSLHPVLARIFSARGIRSAADLDYSLSELLRPDQLGGVSEAARLVADAIEQGRSILIVGDFDADGATGTALAIRCLKAMGHQTVGYLVPNRFEHGYGLSVALMPELQARQADLVMTVDNGISSVAGVAACKALGMTVVVTDHHLPGPTLPAADAIVNPNMPGDPFASKHLSGVGVMFYLMATVRSELTRRRWFDARTAPNLSQFLDLVALGTVADLVPLDNNNRRLVATGLKQIRNKRCCAGISALFRVANRDRSRAQSSDLGYFIGPRLNAAGRLEDISVGIECLLTDEAGEAERLAEILQSLNDERKTLQQTMQEDVLDLLDQIDLSASGDAAQEGVCLFHPKWHQGLVGLIASKVKDQLYRPVIAFAVEGEDSPGRYKGSARSIRGIHIRDVLADVDATHPGLIERFGGHAMAAGLTLEADHFEPFRQAFATAVGQRMNDELRQQVVLTDGVLSGDDLGLDLAWAIEQAGPWGQGFPTPCFEGDFEVLDARIVGARHLKLQVCPVGEQGLCLDAIAFFRDLSALPRDSRHIRLIYELQVNEFRGRQQPQLLISHLIHPSAHG